MGHPDGDALQRQAGHRRLHGVDHVEPTDLQHRDEQHGGGQAGLGSAVGTYTLKTTNNANDLILNQLSTTGSFKTVTVAFFDVALRPIDVSVASVPIDDLSTAKTYEGVFVPVLVPEKSYQDVVTLVGTNTAGTPVTASTKSVTSAYNNVPWKTSRVT